MFKSKHILWLLYVAWFLEQITTLAFFAGAAIGGQGFSPAVYNFAWDIGRDVSDPNSVGVISSTFNLLSTLWPIVAGLLAVIMLATVEFLLSDWIAERAKLSMLAVVGLLVLFFAIDGPSDGYEFMSIPAGMALSIPDGLTRIWGFLQSPNPLMKAYVYVMYILGCAVSLSELWIALMKKKVEADEEVDIRTRELQRGKRRESKARSRAGVSQFDPSSTPHV